MIEDDGISSSSSSQSVVALSNLCVPTAKLSPMHQLTTVIESATMKARL